MYTLASVRFRCKIERDRLTSHWHSRLPNALDVLVVSTRGVRSITAPVSCARRLCVRGEYVCVQKTTVRLRVVRESDNDHRSLALAAWVCPPAVFLLSKSKENALDMLSDKDLKNLLK
jgi:hypothetical protein